MFIPAPVRRRLPLRSLLLALTALLGACSNSDFSRNGSPRPYDQDRPAPRPAAARSLPAPELQVGLASRYQFPPSAPTVQAESYILIDAGTGETLAYRNPDAVRPVASTQKLVTALVVLEQGNLDKVVTIQPEDTDAPPSKMYLKTGDRYTRRQLLTAFLIKSCNDAAEALARDNAGSVEAFAVRMNQKARQLGAYHSRFVNPHGLTEPGQYSTARDMARIAYAAYRDPFIRSVVGRSGCTIVTPRGEKSFETTNKLLQRMPECTGMKTGFTNASGKCLVSSACSGGKHVILVQLGSNTRHIWKDAEGMMRWALRGGGADGNRYLAARGRSGNQS